MSMRAIASRLFRHGQFFLRHFCRRDINTITITEQVQPEALQIVGHNVVPRSFALRSVGWQVGQHARRILIDNVLSRVTNSLASDLRKKAARQMLFGNSRPFFALVGVSLASGTGILTKEEELEGVCLEIREAVSKVKWAFYHGEYEQIEARDTNISVNDLEFGEALGKGANAVVYTAKIVTPADDTQTTSASAETNQEQPLVFEEGHFGNVDLHPKRTEDNDYPLAVKMMFNYDIQSSAMAILKAMYKETIPARIYYSNVGISDWELEMAGGKKHLPPHPNIVAMYSVFTDFVPSLKNATNLYPAALPPRIYEDGSGRNMSLFLIMKRYNCSLQDFVKNPDNLNTRISVLLFTQLLEGISHLVCHGIAHRDLKSDNLLMDLTEGQSPILVITDFGCCLAEKNENLTLSYSSSEMDKGGNTALMAPEIINQQPGTFSVLNYRKSDLWAAGSIAYEIFGAANPFYESKEKKLRSTNYRESDLPPLPESAPTIMRHLVANLLSRNPNRRLDPEVAANICQLYLWAPSSWLKPALVKLPTSTEILQWLLCLTTKVLCEGRLSSATGLSDDMYDTIYNKSGRRTYTEYLLISSFLIRARLSKIRAALVWIHNNCY